jgi:hypothetical protein
LVSVFALFDFDRLSLAGAAGPVVGLVDPGNPEVDERPDAHQLFPAGVVAKTAFRAEAQDRVITVEAHHTLHVMGSRMFRVQPRLLRGLRRRATIRRGRGGTQLAQSVSHDGVLGRCDDDVEFAFGLDLILDGLGRKVRMREDVRP